MNSDDELSQLSDEEPIGLNAAYEKEAEMTRATQAKVEAEEKQRYLAKERSQAKRQAERTARNEEIKKRRLKQQQENADDETVDDDPVFQPYQSSSYLEARKAAEAQSSSDSDSDNGENLLGPKFGGNIDLSESSDSDATSKKTKTPTAAAAAAVEIIDSSDSDGVAVTSAPVHAVVDLSDESSDEEVNVKAAQRQASKDPALLEQLKVLKQSRQSSAAMLKAISTPVSSDESEEDSQKKAREKRRRSQGRKRASLPRAGSSRYSKERSPSRQEQKARTKYTLNLVAEGWTKKFKVWEDTQFADIREKVRTGLCKGDYVSLWFEGQKLGDNATPASEDFDPDDPTQIDVRSIT